MNEPQPPQPTYELIKDVTGKPSPKRGAQVLDAYGYEIKVPYPPKPNCKRCYGRGYVGMVDEQVVVCKKCYPMM